MSETERLLRQQLEVQPRDAVALRQLAEIVGSDRLRKQEAVALWERYVQAVDAEHLGDALYSLAGAQIEARLDADAVLTLHRCIEEAPDRGDAFDLLGELLRRTGQLEEAVAALRRAGELEATAIRPRVALAACLDGLGRTREADAVLAEVADLGAGDPAVAALVRELMHRRG